jgi:CheY-like chemotaxis protein
VRIATALLGAVWLPNEEGGAITLAAGLRPRADDLIDVEIRVGLPLNSKEPLAIASSVGLLREPGPLRSTEDLELRSAALVAHHLGVTFGAVEVPRAVLIRLTCPLVALRPKPPAATPVLAVRRAPVLLWDTPTHPLRPLEPGLAQSGYQPIRAHHPDDALAILFQHAPAAILAAADGASDAPLQFARHLRATSRTATIPIVLVARALDAPQLALARRCVDSVLVAPVNTADAVRHLNGCLHTERRANPRPLELY